MTNNDNMVRKASVAIDMVKAGAQLVMASDAMGRSAFWLLVDGKRVSITRACGVQMPFFQMKRVGGSDSQQVWVMK